MLKIYGVYRSRATRPLWLAEEAGIAFEHVPVVQASRLADPLASDAPLNTRSRQFLAVSPAATIPVIDDDGFVLGESLAITLYLARRYGGDLAPRDEKELALTVQWSLFAVTAVEATALRISSAIAGGWADSQTGKAEVADAAQALAQPLNLLENHLKDHDYFIGSRFTVADINVAEIVRYAQGHAPLLEARPALRRWLENVQARPGFRAMWDKRAAEA